MNKATLVESLRTLPREEQVRLAAQVERLRKVCEEGDSPESLALEPFLEEVLVLVGRMFGAAASAYWLRPWGAGGLTPTTRLGFGELDLSPAGRKVIDATVVQLWQSKEPEVQRHAEFGATVLVGPVRNGQEAVGAVQLIVLDSPSRRLESATEQAGNQSAATTGGEISPITTARAASYRRALSGVLAMIQPAILRRFSGNTLPIQQAEVGLQRLNQQIAGIQRSLRLTIEHHLQQLNGATFNSLQESQQFVSSVQKLLDANGLRVRCPECGYPAILRCSRSPAVNTGVFVFDHYLPSGRTFHGGGRTLPLLRTVAKPSRRKSSS
ncbi:hypothetical protein SH139x_005428 [Planctomycetaceae bacterium SH139]